ncbi:threonine aldolase family protein [Luteipulveratus mongoliensis]|uniref:threonine aldolase family protein n=1 Tax=Luteipulveratus mongoliensis TaxID=571913 RepID=UPI000B0F079A|nr:low specificity L-threonine aldolase [Luteipulveratus mongoliensis]
MTEQTPTLNPLHDPTERGFASDNYSGVHPEILAAIVRANGGHQVSYGDDIYTAELQNVFRKHFGDQAEAFPVFNGTGANVIALQAVTDRWEAVVCTSTAHIHVDECAAPERMGGLKLHVIPTPDGKLSPELLDTMPQGKEGDEHFAQPKVVSITQTTELGTAYTVDEIKAIADYAHKRGWVLHVDGSRLSNAAASLGVPFRTFTTDVGVDIVSFGGTKNGLMVGEAVLVLNPGAVRGMKYLRKQSMQLASKMRFISAQLIALLDDDLYLRNASHANAMATRLAEAVRDVPGVRLMRPVQSNSVFPVLPHDVSRRLMDKFHFYFWDEAAGEVRWMCGFDTTESDVDTFAAAVRAEMDAQA